MQKQSIDDLFENYHIYLQPVYNKISARYNEYPRIIMYKIHEIFWSISNFYKDSQKKHLAEAYRLFGECCIEAYEMEYDLFMGKTKYTKDSKWFIQNIAKDSLKEKFDSLRVKFKEVKDIETEERFKEEVEKSYYLAILKWKNISDSIDDIYDEYTASGKAYIRNVKKRNLLRNWIIDITAGVLIALIIELCVRS